MLPDKELCCNYFVNLHFKHLLFTAAVVVLFRNLTEQLPLKYENTHMTREETTYKFRKCENLGLGQYKTPSWNTAASNKFFMGRM